MNLCQHRYSYANAKKTGVKQLPIMRIIVTRMTSEMHKYIISVLYIGLAIVFSACNTLTE